MAGQGRSEREHEQAQGPWQGGRRQGGRDEDDYPQEGMRTGSVYEEGRGYGQSQGGYGSPEQGGFGPQPAYQSGSRRDYGGYQQGPDHGRPREQGYYQSAGHESQYGRSAPRGASQHTYGQGPEPSSGAYGGAGLGAYSEGTSDIGRGFTGDY